MKNTIYQSVSWNFPLRVPKCDSILVPMMSDALAESSERASATTDPGARGTQPYAIRPREAAMRARGNYDRMFFLRVAHANGVQANLVKSSTIKLAESLKLLAEVSDLLRR